MLELADVTVRFGGLVAVNRVSAVIGHVGVTSIIGPNGAGKTTLFNAICGLSPVSYGSIKYKDVDITNCQAHDLAVIGIGRTFQSPPIYRELTVLDVVKIGGHRLASSNLIDIIFRLPRFLEREKLVDEQAWDALELLGLVDRATDLVSDLSYGQIKRLDIARSILMSPRLLLMDEPAAGLNSSEKEELKEIIVRLVAREIKICLVEHDMSLVADVSEEILALVDGGVICQGPPAEVYANSGVIEAYLGDSNW